MIVRYLMKYYQVRKKLHAGVAWWLLSGRPLTQHISSNNGTGLCRYLSGLELCPWRVVVAWLLWEHLQLKDAKGGYHEKYVIMLNGYSAHFSLYWLKYFLYFVSWYQHYSEKNSVFSVAVMVQLFHLSW